MLKQPAVIWADWPAPPAVRACVSTRHGGVSNAPYDGLNLATHVGDEPAAVAQNRAMLKTLLHLPAEPVWLDQVHGVAVVNAGNTQNACADASFATVRNVVCTVMTADCLPVLLCNRAGTRVAAAHAGWRGLHAGVIEAAVQALNETPDNILVWLGPAIGPQAFEVGEEVHQAFTADLPQSAEAFSASRPGHWLADIYQLARLRLARIGITQIYGGGLCTFSDPERFYSYRRDGKTGRMASLIWIE